MNVGLSRKLAVPPIELVPIYFMVWRAYQAGCPSSVTFPYNMAPPHLMLKDKALFPCWRENWQLWACGKVDFMGNLMGIQGSFWLDMIFASCLEFLTWSAYGMRVHCVPLLAQSGFDFSQQENHKGSNITAFQLERTWKPSYLKFLLLFCGFFVVFFFREIYHMKDINTNKREYTNFEGV